VKFSHSDGAKALTLNVISCYLMHLDVALDKQCANMPKSMKKCDAKSFELVPSVRHRCFPSSAETVHET
jgi:hypothetical protein